MSQKSLKSNFIYNLTNTLLKVVFPFIVFPYVSRILLPEGIGKVNYAMNVVNYFILIAALGIPYYGLREIAKTKDNFEKEGKLFSQIFSVNFVLMLLAYILLASFLYFSIIEKERDLILINSLFILFTFLEAEWYFQGTENYRFITLRNLIVKSLSLIAVFTLVNEKTDYNLYAFILVFGLGGNAVFNFWFVIKRFGIKLLSFFSPRLIIEAFKVHLPLILTSSLLVMISSIYSNLDIVMIGYFSTNEEVGFYTAALKIIKVIISIVLALNTVLLPKASQFFQDNKTEELSKLIKLTIQFIFFISVPSVIIISFFSEELMTLFAGPSFINSARLMVIMSCLVVIVSLINLLGLQILYSINKEKKFLFAITLGVTLNFILNYFLIPTHQGLGACIATISSESLILVLLFYFTRFYFDLTFVTICLKYIVGGIIMYLVILYLNTLVDNSLIESVLLKITSAMAIYLLMLWVAKDKFVRLKIEI